ncbi:hypothetical protein IFM89_014882 [Coptis chinensis]|uniref:Uncharacterized protein n=1 Tax=Coptis chinensis TaxID=261450 RepID=A0A835HEX0_9MAGN|nr:hypothetical protein IFM89_014882 [Coptis chinensis]
MITTWAHLPSMSSRSEASFYLKEKLKAFGGFGSYMIAMDDKAYKLIGPGYPGNRIEDVKNSGLGWMIGFMFVVSFLGLFSLVPLRKVMVMDYKLTY